MTAGRILVGSFGPPQFDRDSGSRRVMDLLDLLIEQRWNVTFASANGLRIPRYAQALQRRGIHVVDGETQSIADLVITGGFDVALLVSWPVA